MPYMHFTMARILALSAPITTLPSIRVPDFATPQYMHSMHLCMQPTRVGVGARPVVFRTARPVANCNLQVALETAFVVSARLAHTALITTLGRDSVEVYCTHIPLRLDYLVYSRVCEFETSYRTQFDDYGENLQRIC